MWNERFRYLDKPTWVETTSTIGNWWGKGFKAHQPFKTKNTGDGEMNKTDKKQNKSSYLITFFIILMVLGVIWFFENIINEINNPLQKCDLTIRHQNGNGFFLPQTGTICNTLKERCLDAKEKYNINCEWTKTQNSNYCECIGKEVEN